MPHLCVRPGAGTPTLADHIEGVGALKPEHEKSIERMEKFLDTLTSTLGRLGAEEEGEEDRAAPKGAAERIAKVVLREEKAKP